ncbi:MAG TPA: hypothetical protein VJ723_01100 [Candidatus Angelobacter sp.]|nr:hypothetical protein [Candidatus Angelobacter sp.]
MKAIPDPPDIAFIREQTALKVAVLLRERQELDRRILSLKQSLRAFDTYLDAERETKLDKYRMDPIPLPPALEGLRELGLTDAVRKIIQSSIEPVNAIQIRDNLVSLDYGKLPKTNPLAAVHAILTRLEKNKKIRPIKEGSAKRPSYEWINQVSDLVDLVEIYEREQRVKDEADQMPERWGSRYRR